MSLKDDIEMLKRICDTEIRDDGLEAISRIEAALAVYEKTDSKVRRYLALSHEDGKCHIYGDDGELQCSNYLRHGRWIDFAREPISDLIDMIQMMRIKEYQQDKARVSVDDGPPAEGDVVAYHHKDIPGWGGDVITEYSNYFVGSTIKPVMLMRAAEVKRRIKEAGK